MAGPSKKQVREIAASLGVPDDSEHVAAVLASISRFAGRQIAMAELPDGDHRDRDIETLEALARAMDGLTANVLVALAHYGVDFGDAAQIAEYARLAKEDIKRRQQPPKRGRRSLTSRAIVLRDLAAIFTDATGRPSKISVTSESKKAAGGRPTGQFFTFMRAAVAPVLTLNGIDDYALAEAVKRATRTKRC